MKLITKLVRSFRDLYSYISKNFGCPRKDYGLSIVPETQITELIRDGRDDILEDARLAGDLFFAEVPEYLTRKGQTAKQIVERFNEEHGTSVSEDRGKLVLNSLVVGKTARKELKNSEDYFSINY